MARKSRRSQAAASEHLEAVSLLNKKREEELLRTAVYRCCKSLILPGTVFPCKIFVESLSAYTKYSTIQREFSCPYYPLFEYKVSTFIVLHQHRDGEGLHLIRDGVSCNFFAEFTKIRNYILTKWCECYIVDL